MKNLKKYCFPIITDNFKSIICQNGIKINCSHILPANKNFTFAIFDIFFLFPAIFDNLPPYSPRSTVPVSGAQTGTVNSPTADTVPVTVPFCVPATAPYTAPSKGSNEVQ